MRAPRSLFVHEYASGGGLPDLPAMPAVARLGEGMLRSVLADMRAWGAARVLTTRDPRLHGPPFDADETLPLSPDTHAAGFAALAARAEAVLVIAPEEGGILAALSETALAAGARLIGSLPQAARLAGNKWECRRLLQKAGLPMPSAVLARPGEIRAAAAELGFPLVIKVVDGQGSSGVCLAKHAGGLDAALAVTGKTAPLLLERFHDGLHASVSLLVANGAALPLCLNSQHIRPGIPFACLGGVAHLRHPAARTAMALAARAARAIPGLRGFVGVDMILSGRHCLIIEVNPRITAAYAGIRHIVDSSLARAVTRACLHGILPARLRVRGQAVFGSGAATG
jgi:predicted ATP-grasp superfamily ATP-dependent carboligase